jgi:hypothetical protein
MRIFFDTEFTGLFQGADLLSIGLMAEDGQSFYCESLTYDLQAARGNEFVATHVLPALMQNQPDVPRGPLYSGSLETGYIGAIWQVGDAVLRFLQRFDTRLEMWSDCYAYDWVLFCELWGGALKIPAGIYYIPFDLSTLLWACHYDPDVDREVFAGLTDHPEKRKHHALWDAKVIKACFERLSYELHTHQRHGVSSEDT